MTDKLSLGGRVLGGGDLGDDGLSINDWSLSDLGGDMPYSIAQIRQVFKKNSQHSNVPMRWLDDWLLYVLDKPPVFLFSNPDDSLDEAQRQQLQAGLVRLMAGEPLAYVLGQIDFWRYTFLLSPAVLIPRPDTELLVETALSLLQDQVAPCVLDMGTGSGCIAISLALDLQMPNSVYACDISMDALAIAKKNAERLSAQVHFVQSNWYEHITGRFDMIVANPPYIAYDDEHLSRLCYEPSGALIAAQDGLADIATITAHAHRYLKAGGYLLIEHGYQQGSAVRQLFARHFNHIRTLSDYGGNERLTLGQLKL